MKTWQIWILSFVINISIMYSVPMGSSEEIVLVTSPVPVTFIYPSSVLRFQPWNFQKYYKLDIRFSTRERRGILFFVGSSSATHDCVGIDIFNSNVYVYGILNAKEFRVQMNPIGTSVSNGRFYNVAIQLLPTGYMTMFFEDVPNPTMVQAPPLLQFDTYTYIGGIDSTYRLPWIAHAQVGFAGSMEYLRVNDNKFIDTNKFAKQTEMQGVKTGVAETSVARCIPGLCDPGKCEERTYNIKDSSKNFFCDCSGTMKTYSSMTSDITRGETCIRDVTPFQCDKKSFLFYDFDVEQITHTDDISLDFKTTSTNEPLFFAKRKHGIDLTTFMSAEVLMGQVFVSMKLQEGKDDRYKKVFIAPIIGLNDGRWHTLKITRYVQEVKVYVDIEANVVRGDLYRSTDGEKFYNKIRELYVGSRTATPGTDKCSGTLKNFYWNEYDLLNTRNYLSRYQSQIISEKPQLPILPPFPRSPPIPCTFKPSHQRTVIPNVPLLPTSSIFMIEVRTKYDGIVFHAEVPKQLDEYITVLIIGNSVVVAYHIGLAKGVTEIELTRGGINIRDNSWHRIILELSKMKSSMTIFVDDVQDVTRDVIFQNTIPDIPELTFSMGGFSEVIQYYKVVSKLQEFSSLLLNSFSDIKDLKFVGCLGEFLTNKDSFSNNLLLQNTINHFPTTSVFCRACQEVTKCPRNFCQNNGQCYNVNENMVACNCSSTNFNGQFCDIKNPSCSPSDCSNGGKCLLIGGVKTCDCTGTGYTGVNCEVSRCTNFVCQNNGICRLINGQPTCDCSGTTFSGLFCEQSQCPKDFCRNNGQCKLDPVTGLPFCDCKGTGNIGVRCDKPLCPSTQCNGNGNCVIRDDKPFCYCYDDFVGDNCEKPVCPKDYCLFGGSCTSSFKKPKCICTSAYEGNRCEIAKPCPPNSCLYGGSCKMVSGRPICNCTNTDYFGSKCEQPKMCPNNYCQNRGKCSVVKNNFVCDCTDTGYTGSTCDNKLGCPDGFCQNGGICSNEKGKFVCDCSQTGYIGDSCNQKSNGIMCPYQVSGYPVKIFKPPKVSSGMITTVGFQTWVHKGTIFCYQTMDDKYWSAKLLYGKLALDINGMIFNMKTKVNDGKYHVIKVTRDERIFLVSLDVPVVETLTIPIQITNILSLPNNLIAYTKLILCNSCPDTDIANQFQGAVGGEKSGNDSLSNNLSSGNSVALIGDVQSTLVPVNPLPKPQLVNPCTSAFCNNGGICTMKNYFPSCDCGTSGFEGERCDKKIFIIKSVPPNPGYIIHNIIPAIPRNFDLWRFLANFMNSSSPLATFILSDGNYVEFQYVNGKILVSTTGIPQGFLNTGYLDPNVPHFFRVQNMLGRLTMHVNKTKTGAINLPENFLMANGSIKVIRIIVGANKNLDDTIKGFIGGYRFNSDNLLLPNGKIMPSAKSVRNIRVEPWIEVKKRMLLSVDTKLGSHGGMVYINGRSIFANGFGAGAIVPSGSGPIVMGPVISLAGTSFHLNVIALGFFIAALLLIAAIIWAVCYLGLTKCSISNSLSGAAVPSTKADQLAVPLLISNSNGNNSLSKAIYDEQDFVATSPKGYRLDLNKANSEMIASTNANMLQGFHTFGGGNTFGGGRSGFEASSREYGTSNYLTVPTVMPAQIQMNTNMQQDIVNERIQGSRSENLFSQGNYGHEMVTANAFTDEEIKVESCILSDDSKFAVTGSISGPPQIWDMTNGDLIRLMSGADLTYTNLHLAVNSNYLVGLVAENQQSSNIKKLTMWSFETGEQINIREQYLCTICCISIDGMSCILADETKESAITIYNLRNGQSQKLFYNQPETMFNEGIQLLKISNNSQYIIAGCRTSSNTSNYIIIDQLRNSIEDPKVIKIKSLLHACSFINDKEFVIGTDIGELVVWNLETGVPMRQIVIRAALDSGKEGMLKPHENRVNCIEVSKDGLFMVTGGADTRVRVWNMRDETLIQNITKHDDEIQSVALSNDNEILVTGSWDGSIRTWNMKSGQEMCSFVSSIEITKVLISNDKSVLVALGEKAGVNKLVMLKIVRNISKVNTAYSGQMSTNGTTPSIVSPPL